jgi:hypothetical protein
VENVVKKTDDILIPESIQTVDNADHVNIMAISHHEAKKTVMDFIP